jgi:hypothetical protein
MRASVPRSGAKMTTTGLLKGVGWAAESGTWIIREDALFTYPASSRFPLQYMPPPIAPKLRKKRQLSIDRDLVRIEAGRTSNGASTA